MPDYWELFSPDHGPSGAVNAFTGVQPERAPPSSTGLQFGPRVQAWVSAYAGQIQDYILFTYHGSGMMGSEPGQQRRCAHRRCRSRAGSEPGCAVEGGTLAYAWGENRDQQRPLPQMPPLEARLSANWEGQRWSAGALLRAVTHQHRVADGQGTVVAQDQGRSAGFATFALNAAYRFSSQQRKLKVRASTICSTAPTAST